MKLKALQFGLAGGILIAIWYLWVIIATMLHIASYGELARVLEVYGYSISFGGLIIGIIYGFIEGFITLWLLALIYNALVK